MGIALGPKLPGSKPRLPVLSPWFVGAYVFIIRYQMGFDWVVDRKLVQLEATRYCTTSGNISIREILWDKMEQR